jgi:hypothetical protein
MLLDRFAALAEQPDELIRSSCRAQGILKRGWSPWLVR